ncbi:MAG: sigma-70 family RNA polymerase sigma factor [Acidimicrobiales bacterium]
MGGAQEIRFEDAFGGLFRLAYRVSFRILGDRGDAEDVAQEALARTHLRWDRLAERPEGWVVRVATNLAIDRYRRRRRRTMGRPELTLIDAHLAERLDLAGALRGLPRRQRQVVVLRYLADWSEADVAAALDCTAGTVKVHAFRGLAALREHLGDAMMEVGDVRASG